MPTPMQRLATLENLFSRLAGILSRIKFSSKTNYQVAEEEVRITLIELAELKEQYLDGKDIEKELISYERLIQRVGLALDELLQKSSN